ncbi:MAG: hypothetical protein HQ567_13375 [Candidatus Nealsonbacteria bacterium]|nr:hypothetical protein [Candidatus Nealsonbacteria bacterium]
MDGTDDQARQGSPLNPKGLSPDEAARVLSTVGGKLVDVGKIRTELDSNELLLEDFPEVCFPIQALDGIANRCSGQLYQGPRTHIGWTAREIVLPTIPESKASGAIIKVAGITGRIRGMKSKTPDGRSLRPSLVVLDDPQTDESARSLSQCATRESILAGAVLGLSGPGKKISGIMPCTVIRPGDKGCLSLFGSKPDQHRLFAEHITAEYRVKTQGRGRTVDEWKLRPSAVDNHWLDCLVGSAVAASIQGAVLFGTDVKPVARRTRVRLSDMRRDKR